MCARSWRAAGPASGRRAAAEKSKFGLTAGELVRVVERLREASMLDCLELLHFHIGSQITANRAIKDALKEATRIYAQLHGLGAGLQFIDVGGGLAVDYDGSQTNFHSSANYSLQEYANDVVFAVQQACDEKGVSHPVIVSESGRLRDEGVVFYRHLNKNGVKARCRQSIGTTHGVELFSIAAPDISRDLARDIAAFCKG